MRFSRCLSDAVSFCLTLALVPIAAVGQSKRIAVYDFEYKAVRNDVIQVYGTDKNVGAQAANRIISKLVGKGSFEVIDRNQIDNLMKEQNLKFSDRFDPREAPKLGKLLNVDAIVTGSVDGIADEVQNNRVGVGPVGLGKVQSVAEVTLSVRVISTESAQIFMAEQVNNKQTHSLGKGGRVGKNGGDGGTVAVHPWAMAVTEAVQGAADDIAAKIIAKADSLPVRTGARTAATKSAPSDSGSSGNASPAGNPRASSGPPDTGLQVGKVDGNRIYITAGENAGIKVNDYFEVRHVTGSMKDAQGNAIEMDERVETVMVTDVQDKFAVAKMVSGTAAAVVGDKLKRTKAPAAAPKKATPAAPAAGAAGLPAPVQRKQ